MKMTLANLITVGRIVLVPIFLVILLTEFENEAWFNQNREWIAFGIFLLASVTDAVDGYFARKFNQITELGKFLDPLADKFLVAGALLALVSMDRVATWVAAVIIMREIFITGFRFYFMVKDSAFSASWIAKKKTLFQIIAIGLLIIYSKMPEPDLVFKIGTYVLYFAVILTIYSGIEYIIKFTRSTQTVEEIEKGN